MAVLLENSGLLKAGPTTAEFEPVQGKTVKFSDVHGVDEAKDVWILGLSALDFDSLDLIHISGAPRSCGIFEGPNELRDARRKTAQGRPPHRTSGNR